MASANAPTRVRRASVSARASAAVRAPAPSRAPAPRRPPLRVVGPRRRRPARRRPLALAVGAALASLLAVGAAHAYLVQGQVRLAHLEQQLTAAQDQQRDLQVQLSRLEDPSHVVTQAEQQGLTVPSQVTDLPLVGAGASASSAPGR
jgi:uncharacterized protein HemX